jgi:hypothetical protein
MATRFPSSALASILAVWLLAPGAGARDLPTLPECTDHGADHSRQGMKTREAPASFTVSAGQQIHVSDMLHWRVPTGVASADRDSDNPLAPREKHAKLLALTGFVRLVKLETDCDFHIQVAESEAPDTPEVIVEIPRSLATVQRQLMALVGMTDGANSKTWKAKPPPHLRFVGFAFLDEAHQFNPAHHIETKEGTGHGPAGIVQTLWELHPVVRVSMAQ